MNICLNSFSSYSASFLKETILPSLTSQQKKIIVIASIAFGLLAALYVASRCCFGSTEKEFEDQQDFKPDDDLKTIVNPPIDKEILTNDNKKEDEILSYYAMWSARELT